MNITRTFSLDLESAMIVENQENASKWMRLLIKRRGTTVADLLRAEDRNKVLYGALQRVCHKHGEDLNKHIEAVKQIHEDNDSAKEPLKGLALWSKIVGAEEVKE